MGFNNLFTVLNNKKVVNTPYKTAQANVIQECIFRCDSHNLIAVDFTISTRSCRCFSGMIAYTDSPGWKTAFLKMVKSYVKRFF